MLEELYEQYGQFLVMGLVFLVGFAVFYAYTYYKNQENIKSVNNNIKLEVKDQPNQKPPQPRPPNQKQPDQKPVQRKPPQMPDFVPSNEFKGKQSGYTYKNGEKGQGYYMDKK